MDDWVVSDIAVPHITMLRDVGAQSFAGNRETLHFFDVIATDSLSGVRIQITVTKPNDDEIQLVLELHDARVAAEVLIGLHTHRGSKTSAACGPLFRDEWEETRKPPKWRPIQVLRFGGADGARTRDLRRDRPRVAGL
ncbi:MAG: hypothetical protein JO231_11895 [Acidobacteria bacterium]|nr:hypothetical protein [Acidobacteriota bacterium]